MIRRRNATPLAVLAVLGAIALPVPVGVIGVIEPPCAEPSKAECLALKALEAELSTAKAGPYPDLTSSSPIVQSPLVLVQGPLVLVQGPLVQGPLGAFFLGFLGALAFAFVACVFFARRYLKYRASHYWGVGR
jgi:hypothetical protein